MRPADAHLSPHEVEQLLFGIDDSNNNAGGGAAPEAQQHLSGCAVCQAVAERYRKADAKLKALGASKQGPSNRPTSGSACPPDDTWVRLAANLIEDDEAKSYVTHASTCDWCGPLLKEALEDLAQEMTPEEEEALAQLPTASLAWQRQMANKLAEIAGDSTRAEEESVKKTNDARHRTGLDRGKKRGLLWWPKVVWVATGAAIMALAAWVGLLIRGPDVNQLLAQASTKQRTSELRMPGAHYAPPRVERGSGALRPIELAEAEVLIRRKLEKQPGNPSLLQSMGRLEVLTWDYGRAIDTLKHALELDPESVSLRIDLASAYFERGEDTGHQSDYNEALYRLGQALEKSPDDPVALFNRAIVSEKTLAHHQALADWEHYLRLRPDDEWSHEARDRRDEVRKKINEHDQKATEPLSDAAGFADRLNKERSTGNASVDLRIEEYQQKAVDEWLTGFFYHDRAPSRNEEAVGAALRALARQMETRHADRWFSDLLQEPATSNFRSGLAALRNAIGFSASGNASRAEAEAQKAIHDFKRAKSVPGMARAGEEKVYALQMQLKYRQCLNESRPLMNVLTPRHYAWLQSQIEMEQAICANGIADFSNSEKSAARALELARLHSFPTLELRILGTDAFNLYDRGLAKEGLQETQEGLRKYWQAASPPIRGYQLYWNLFSAAEAKAEWHLAVVYGQEAVHEIALTGFRMAEASARSRLALVAAKAGNLDLARTQAGLAEDMIAKLTGNRADPYVVDLKIARAEVELKTGNPSGAIELLKEVKPEVDQLSHYAILLHYYATLGNSAMRKNLLEESSSALNEAIRIGDAAAQTLHSDQDRLAWEKATGFAYRSAVELRMVRRDYAAALDLWENYRSIAVGERSGQRKRGAERLGDGTTAVVWAVLPDGLATWVQSDGRLDGVWTALDTDTLESRAARLAELCSTPTTSLSEISVISRHLYATLLGALGSHLHDGDLLVVEADGLLAAVPVQVLESESGALLADTHPVVYTLSLRHYLDSGDAIATMRIDRNSRAVIVASRNGEAGSGNAVVYNADQEAKAIAAHFAATILLESHQGILEETKRKLSRADVFDFVGHSADMRGQSGLVLWSRDDGASEVLRAADVWVQHSHLKLVVLSACSTGKASDDGLLDANGLVHSFLGSGTTAVVATGWSLDSEVAIRYMDMFYPDVTNGDQIPHSLWRASLKIRQQQPYAHPYFWAAFQSYA
jgi:CHAT domain-containing protein/cytochrome c-type biogenesis protein CcmH/NrfG